MGFLPFWASATRLCLVLALAVLVGMPSPGDRPIYFNGHCHPMGTQFATLKEVSHRRIHTTATVMTALMNRAQRLEVAMTSGFLMLLAFSLPLAG
jgi:hypothetical protein